MHLVGFIIRTLSFYRIGSQPAGAVAAPKISATPEHYEMDIQQLVTSAVSRYSHSPLQLILKHLSLLHSSEYRLYNCDCMF